jgi:hypothetical protein
MILDLPKEGEKGSLTLGGIPEELTNHNQTRVPLSNAKGHELTGTWQTKLDSVFLSGNIPVNASLSDFYLTFELGAGLQLPPYMFNSLLKAIGAKRGPLYPTFNCTRWDDMPDIILTASGHDIAITREDYALHGFGPGGEEVCLIKMDSLWNDANLVGLGPEMLKRYYVVFDMDEDEFGCKSSTFSMSH